MVRMAFSLLAFLFLTASSFSQEKFPIFVTGGDDSKAVVQALIEQFRDSKPFVPVHKNEDSHAAVLVDCMSREEERLPFTCMYVLHYNGATFKTFIGGGIYMSMRADQMANRLVGSIAADIAERFNNANRENLRASLESCLFLTDSKCNVPVPLQEEMGASQLSLGQYLLKRRK